MGKLNEHELFKIGKKLKHGSWGQVWKDMDAANTNIT